MTRPVLTIVAGSNGCGKSTLTSGSKGKFQSHPLLDPDAVAKSIQDTLSVASTDIEAGKRVLRLADEYIEVHQSFTVETTLSGSTYLRNGPAREVGGIRCCRLFCGNEVGRNQLRRVASRVTKGGHDVPEEDQRRRFPRTLANFSRLMLLADVVVMFDNSTDAGHRLVAAGHVGFMHWVEPVPTWAVPFREL